jgi:hypothetical protein
MDSSRGMFYILWQGKTALCLSRFKESMQQRSIKYVNFNALSNILLGPGMILT